MRLSENGEGVRWTRSVWSAPACRRCRMVLGHTKAGASSAPYTHLGSGTRPQQSRTPCSPSPLPSPTGRGRTVWRLAANQRAADGRTRKSSLPHLPWGEGRGEGKRGWRAGSGDRPARMRFAPQDVCKAQGLPALSDGPGARESGSKLPHSKRFASAAAGFRIPHSAFRTPHSALRTLGLFHLEWGCYGQVRVG